MSYFQPTSPNQAPNHPLPPEEAFKKQPKAMALQGYRPINSINSITSIPLKTRKIEEKAPVEMNLHSSIDDYAISPASETLEEILILNSPSPASNSQDKDRFSSTSSKTSEELFTQHDPEFLLKNDIEECLKLYEESPDDTMVILKMKDLLNRSSEDKEIRNKLFAIKFYYYYGSLYFLYEKKMPEEFIDTYTKYFQMLNRDPAFSSLDRIYQEGFDNMQRTYNDLLANGHF